MVSRVVLLDAGPLGLATNPKPSPRNLACSAWLQSLIEAGVRVIVPEIADYEVRRELLRANKVNGLALLDTLTESLDYLPLTTAAMRRAARLWADARQSGQPTAGDNTIDGDVILAAQALSLGVDDYVVATTNVGHLSRFAPAQLWNEIEPPTADLIHRHTEQHVRVRRPAHNLVLAAHHRRVPRQHPHAPQAGGVRIARNDPTWDGGLQELTAIKDHWQKR